MRTMPLDEAIDLIRGTVGTDQTTRTDPEVAIDSIAAELNRLAKRYAIVHVKPAPNVDAWPVVERVAGGWQSGAHHYPDSAVLDVRPLTS